MKVCRNILRSFVSAERLSSFCRSSPTLCRRGIAEAVDHRPAVEEEPPGQPPQIRPKNPPQTRPENNGSRFLKKKARKYGEFILFGELVEHVKKTISPVSNTAEEAGHSAMLNDFLTHYYRNATICATELLKRQSFVERLTHLCRRVVPDCTLQAFGSSVSGFGLHDSDIDISFQSERLEDMGMRRVTVLQNLAQYFRQHPNEVNLQSFAASARVPVLRLADWRTGLFCDMSAFGQLGVKNSQLLSAYSKVDERVAVLGVLLKKMTKTCMIASVRDGSLSSYAYILMLIFYLQRTDPPVVPCLQELWNGKEDGATCPVETTNGWNTYFLSDIDDLDRLWPGRGKNTQSIADLWLGFLWFYLHFDFVKDVIAIRTLENVTGESVGWDENLIKIEDPFKLDHNTGRQISPRVAQIIYKIFGNTYNHFKKPVSLPPEMLENYFFDVHTLLGRKSSSLMAKEVNLQAKGMFTEQVGANLSPASSPVKTSTPSNQAASIGEKQFLSTHAAPNNVKAKGQQQRQKAAFLKQGSLPSFVWHQSFTR